MDIIAQRESKAYVPLHRLGRVDVEPCAYHELDHLPVTDDRTPVRSQGDTA
jgi:hypothetical protein